MQEWYVVLVRTSSEQEAAPSLCSIGADWVLQLLHCEGYTVMMMSCSASVRRHNDKKRLNLCAGMGLSLRKDKSWTRNVCYICVLWETHKLQYPCTVMVMVQMMITFFVTARRNSEQEEAQSLCNKGWVIVPKQQVLLILAMALLEWTVPMCLQLVPNKLHNSCIGIVVLQMMITCFVPVRTHNEQEVVQSLCSIDSKYVPLLLNSYGCAMNGDYLLCPCKDK